MNKVLVIGGSGFMGSHTADLLSENGYNVTIFDRVESPWLRDDQTMIVGDVMDSNLLASAMNTIDYVFYFAGIADIAEAKINPLKTIELNIMGLTRALEAGVSNKIEKFIYASTMYVYSAQGAFYRASKQAAEVIIEAYQENYQLNFVLLRYGSLYGPRSQKWNGIKGFALQVVNTGALEYLGNGSEIREYIHVHDAAKLSVRALKDEYNNKAITITGVQSMKVSQMFSMLFEIAGKKLNVKYLDEQQGSSHYGNTPYRYTPKPSLKIVPTEFVDLGQGLLDIVEEIHNVQS
ncbi:MAG: NAD-dependent epimerase/dehydratase family protein [Paracoccaceae bacterium]